MGDEPPRAHGGGEAKRRLARGPAHGPHAPRAFTTPDGEWLARHAGGSVGGTGTYNLALLEAVHFARAERPEAVLREALVGRGAFERLSEEELLHIWAQAKALPEPRA